MEGSSRRFSILRPLSLLVILGCGVRLFAVSYVVPKDRFEIERSSAIIVGRVLRSHTERSPRFGIETITDVVLEEAIKGDVDTFIQIHEPGGVVDDDAVLIPGVPDFADGERVLLLLYQRENGGYTVSDLQLGSFHFAKDDSGEELLLRNESELIGWDLDGTVHQEQHRSAERFIRYIRGIVHGDAVAEDYFVAKRTLAIPGSSRAERGINGAPAPNGKLPVTYAAAFSPTSYTVNVNGGLGARWNVFPSIVNWNRGNSEVGVLGSGASQINSAFNAWNSGGAHYVLAGATANAKGLFDASDGVNNIVFEKNLTSSGVQPYSCTQGGILGLGGIHFALFGGGAHLFQGETFGTAKEGDVSMNQGLGSCTAAQFPPGEFATTVTHEVGHTLGLRHSDQTRTQDAVCSSDPTLDCSNSAVMDHLLVFGLNGQLQPWDSRAVSAVYGNAACTPPAINQQPFGLTITSGNAATLTVTATGTPTLTYQWFAGQSGNTSTPVAGGITSTITVSPPVTTSYWVRVSGPCAPAADSVAATITVNPAGCPTVVISAVHATPVSGGTQLSVTATGGTSFTYVWFAGPTPGTGSQIGVGNPLLVNPNQTTTYWCRVTNNCSNTANSAIVTAIPCAPPQITNQPQDQTALAGSTVLLTIAFTGTSPAVTWYQGAKGDASTPVGSGATITSPVLTQTAQFWARITNSCSSVDSEAATVSVTAKFARRRAARH